MSSDELETQFVAQPGDEDVLWTVEEITAERGNKYKVKWAGIDPETGKPWPQSWVAKHDCTDDLVIDWKAKKKLRATGKKRDRGTGAASGASGTSKQAGSSGTRSHRSTSKATSRLDSIQEEVPPPPPPPPPQAPRSTAVKRKRQAEPSTARAEGEDEAQDVARTGTRPSVKRKRRVEVLVAQATTTSGADAQSDEMAPRPRKKKRTLVEVLLPPISSDEEADALSAPASRARATVQDEVHRKRNGVSLDVPEEEEEEEEDRSPPKGKGKPAPAQCAPTAREERPAKTKNKGVPRRKEHDLRAGALFPHSEDEDLRPLQPKKKITPKHKPSSEQHEDASENEVESTALPIKIGPPRGVKRRDKLRDAELPRKLGPSGTKPREDDHADKRAPEEESAGQLDREVTPSSDPVSRRRNNKTSAPPHISVPQVPPAVFAQNADLSPRAMARLELFDRMMENGATPPPDLSEVVPDDTHDIFDIFEPPPPSDLPPTKSKLKPSKVGTPNGLIVPETESSNISQSQSPHKVISLPAIAFIAASVPPSSVSPKPQNPPPHMNRPTKKSTTKITPSTLRQTTNARSRVDDEVPPSSIESFPSPRRVDKGKQKAVEEDQLQSSPSDAEEGGAHPNRRVKMKITDPHLKRRGKALVDQAQLAREAERQKNKKPKRLKIIDEIINGSASLPTKGPPLLFASAADDVLGLQWDDVIDLSGGANSATLDTVAHSETRPLSEEQRERLRIELRQEEEESTQEAMGIYPPPPEEPSAAVNGLDAQMPPPRSSKHSSQGGHVEDGDHVEQPSADLIQASVIVQPSQEQRHSETDLDPLLANRPHSSPPRPIPENLTDSPKRRLGEALSLLNVKSEEIQRLERELMEERKNVQRLTAELTELQQSSEPAAPVRAAWDADRAQWAQERSKWESDAALWETQRKKLGEENESLSARLTELSDVQVRAEEASAKLAKLEAQRDIWIQERETMVHDMTHRSAELASLGSVRGEYDESQLKWGAEKVLWVEEKERWEAERTALQEKQEALSRSVDELTAAVEPATAAKASAEKDRDFFREQYVRASEFVGTVREENTELEKKVKIAEGQAREGVAGIKALFEGRVKALQADLDRWKGLAALLQEKDRRTNDELRLRAAQVPELIALCDRLSEDNKSLDADVRRLGRSQHRSVLQRNKLFYDMLLLKRERASLRSKLSKLRRAAGGTTSQDASAPPPPPPPPPPVPVPTVVVDHLDNVDPNDMPIFPDPTPPQSADVSMSFDVSFDDPGLFPCQWRPLLRDQCQQVFDTKEDLERHMREHFRELRVQ